MVDAHVFADTEEWARSHPAVYPTGGRGGILILVLKQGPFRLQLRHAPQCAALSSHAKNKIAARSSCSNPCAKAVEGPPSCSCIVCLSVAAPPIHVNTHITFTGELCSQHVSVKQRSYDVVLVPCRPVHMPLSHMGHSIVIAVLFDGKSRRVVSTTGIYRANPGTGKLHVNSQCEFVLEWNYHSAKTGRSAPLAGVRCVRRPKQWRRREPL